MSFNGDHRDVIHPSRPAPSRKKHWGGVGEERSIGVGWEREEGGGLGSLGGARGAGRGGQGGSSKLTKKVVAKFAWNLTRDLFSSRSSCFSDARRRRFGFQRSRQAVVIPGTAERRGFMN